MADDKSSLASKSSSFTQRKKRRIEWWKRKRSWNEESNDDVVKDVKQPRKKQKHDELVNNKERTNAKKENKKSTSRFILFIGNLSFDCSEENIRNHFNMADDLVDVRILTNKTTGKSKGCAFLEFKNKKSQMKALQLHHSSVCGRRVNVEVTCGGGGNGEQRINKLKSKIDKMKEKRKKAKIKKKENCKKAKETLM
ncbi:uncharacterized RNA-binding protein C365.04c-like [Xenia sp. Carnegie-2017]|uniref:uncharacterized RNA-binding protein C365.04c-like n=1 Tax=Xenia sp. Carnegie-2017 TaxID=2897299 RepID=UPI001F03422D|nr:uncharacterized RNA-binding protein C365.04c-like [Xenia sp. Carnegie-2017]